MRNMKWLVAAGLVAATAGCVESSGYPSSSYSSHRGDGDGAPDRYQRRGSN